MTWQGARNVEVLDVPEPQIERPTDAVVRITSTAICGSDLHLYDPLAPFMHAGDVIGHEPMGIVEEVGAGVERLQVGDRVVVPFNIACGDCWMCDRQLYSQCETTQNHEHGTGASLFGYSELYGSVPGGQAEFLRVPFADVGPIVVPQGPPDERYLFLSDVVPTAWQAVVDADVPETDGVLAVIGLGPIGQMAVRAAKVRGVARVLAVDLVPERLDLAARYGAEVFDLSVEGDVAAAMRAATDGRGPDAVVDAVGLEAHGSGAAEVAQKAVGLLPDAAARAAMLKAGIDRTHALQTAIAAVRRGGTLSLSGVYGGAATPMPLLTLFDKQVTIRQGQCNVRRWIDELLPLIEDPSDPLGTEDLVTHRVPLERAPEMYTTFREKDDGCIKVVLQP